jgi:cytochrome c553
MPPQRPLPSCIRLAFTRRFKAVACLALGALFAHPAASQPADMDKRVAPCTACHGQQGRAASDGYYPRIAGKPAGYLYNQLLNFRDGRRQQYPLMVYTVQHLSDDYLLEMANFFAQQTLPYPPAQTLSISDAILDRGRVLALEGDAGRDLPACSACHGSKLTGIAPWIPGVLGLPRDYINAQFGAWRNGTRRTQVPDCMSHIAQRMNVDEISAVSAWLATQAVPNDGKPESTSHAPLPLKCGSAPAASEQELR